MSSERIQLQELQEADRISNVPLNVTQQILECIPLHEAARTSILSSHWRSKWTLTSQLILDEPFFTSILKGKETCDISLAYSNAVSNILLSHVGLICKFYLYLPSWLERDLSHMLRFAYANGVKDFTLEYARGSHAPEKKLPTCLFSFVGLTHLTLIKCILEYLPPTFRGFPCLISLKYETGNSADSPAGTGTREASILKIIISKCPLLERLHLSVDHRFRCTTVQAPKLQDLFVRGSLFNLSLEGNISIKVLSLDIDCMLWYQKRAWIIAFFKGLPNVEKLIFKWKGSDFWIFSFLYEFKFPNSFERLQILQLVGVPLYSVPGISFIRCLLLNSPNLEQLYVDASSCTRHTTDQSIVEFDRPYIFHRLQTVQLIGILRLSNDLQLIKFLLACSPMLEEMTIELSTRMGDAEEKINFFKESMRFRRASPKAEVIIKK